MPITTDTDANATAKIWKPFSERFDVRGVELVVL